MELIKKRFTTGKLIQKTLLPQYLNKVFMGENYLMFIRKSLNHLERYEVEITEKKNKYIVVYCSGRVSATKVFDIATKYSIKI
jgi:hypothetical protein